MRKLPYQSSLQFIQRPQLLWSDIGDRKLWGGIQWIRHGPTVPSRLSWNAYQSNIPKLRSGIRWKHGMRRFSEYGNVASRNIWTSPINPHMPTKITQDHPNMLNRKPNASHQTSDIFQHHPFTVTWLRCCNFRCGALDVSVDGQLICPGLENQTCTYLVGNLLHQNLYLYVHLVENICPLSLDMFDWTVPV